ncbi:hypothetical protein Pst134EA_029318 [Puccinia striiformis f. sp. tritici]|uniref:hypothetical protein n=1 Tax=Puccinia striiformis f. sp. tritici TaxID=168172 RepID=UPI002007E868|nr:hypothetical protein Pst134EA_029318 [Puccinia striiformis f. sp. tritici]KAH9441313.1 hypothetical protein Pst134EB_029974 [Puccinia striiformis f. sp. tritici]KAH9447284.1 hypothetical protein Pst134EA_029318 [Puccinia striiformis f. sp. tritici]
MVGKPSISTESESLDPAVLDRLLLQTGTLSPVYHRSPGIFIWHTKPKYLRDSPALNPAAKKLYQESLEIAVRRPPPVPETITVPKARAPAAVTKEDVSTEDSPRHLTANPHFPLHPIDHHRIRTVRSSRMSIEHVVWMSMRIQCTIRMIFTPCSVAWIPPESMFTLRVIIKPMSLSL